MYKNLGIDFASWIFIELHLDTSSSLHIKEQNFVLDHDNENMFLLEKKS